MSHKSIRLLIEKTVDSISDDIQYSYGPVTDFNQTRKKGSVLVNTSPLVATASYRVNGVQNYMNLWSVTMAFYKPDKSGEKEYAKILDDTDNLIDKFVNELNFFSSMSTQIIVSAVSKTSFIKATADILTGWSVVFQIDAMDTFDYCPDCP